MFFSTLIPQPNGAAFAGVRLNLSPPMDLTGYNTISITGRGRGDNDKVKFQMRDGTLDANNERGTYRANFTVRESNQELEINQDKVYGVLLQVNLSSTGLEEYQIQVSDLVYEERGQVNSTWSIDLSNITQVRYYNGTVFCKYNTTL